MMRKIKRKKKLINPATSFYRFLKATLNHAQKDSDKKEQKKSSIPPEPFLLNTYKAVIDTFRKIS